MTGIWETADIITKARMNEKTVIQATGAVINGLTTYAGMMAFCTSTGSGFIADTLYIRNSTNASWGIVGVVKLYYVNFGPDDFTSYADQAAADAVYPSSDTAKARVNITTDLIDFNSVLDSTNDSISRDLGGSLDDTLWVLRFHMIVTALTLTAGTEVFINIGFSSADHTITRTAAQDSISFNLSCDNLNRGYRISNGDGASMNANNTAGMTETVTNGDNYYIELKKTSGTGVTANIYSNAAFTTLVETQNATVATNITGLRYFVIKNGGHATATGSITVTIDDVGLQNGVSTWV